MVWLLPRISSQSDVLGFRITPAIRNEPAAEVSEFSFHSKKKSTSGKTVFKEDDLIRAIKKKQPKVAQKLETAKKAKTLLKPLETIHEKKVCI